jgi:hypothetical protein
MSRPSAMPRSQVSEECLSWMVRPIPNSRVSSKSAGLRFGDAALWPDAAIPVHSHLGTAAVTETIMNGDFEPR